MEQVVCTIIGVNVFTYTHTEIRPLVLSDIGTFPQHCHLVAVTCIPLCLLMVYNSVCKPGIKECLHIINMLDI